MRRRAFVPEAPGRLEGRALLSGSRGPVHLSAAAFGLDLLQIKGDFQQFSISGDLALLRAQLAMRAAPVPFSRVDGLGQRVNLILGRLEADLAARIPGAINTAYNEVITGIRADVQARINNGTVVVDR